MDRSASLARDYLVAPDVGRGPGVLVCHSGRGLTPFVEQCCQRLARRGYVALAVDLFDGATPTTVPAAEAAAAGLDEATVRRRLEDAATYLQDYDATSRRRIGVVGIGYGAECACLLAESLADDVGAVVLFYGLGAPDWSVVAAPVLGHFAELDGDIPPSRVRALRETLRTAGVDGDLFVYPGAEPSFLETDATARHDPDAARLAWERTARFLRDALHTRSATR